VETAARGAAASAARRRSRAGSRPDFIMTRATAGRRGRGRNCGSYVGGRAPSAARSATPRERSEAAKEGIGCDFRPAERVV